MDLAKKVHNCFKELDKKEIQNKNEQPMEIDNLLE
jgi:hypothetical protein